MTTPDTPSESKSDPESSSADQVDHATAPSETTDAAEVESDSTVATPAHPFRQRMPAPALAGGTDWLNSAGPIDLHDLRGKFVLLDFWTYCCINCQHILPELKKLEEAYPNELVVIGVHSAKFDTEKGTDNIRDAVLRHGIEHPVVNDSEHRIWSSYFVNSWPSLRIIDPEGYLVVGHSGEITFEELDGFLRTVLPYYRQQKLLDETPLHFDQETAKAQRTPLRYPGKILADEPGNRLFIADSSHHRIVVTDLQGKLLTTIGTGAAGRDDGSYDQCTFNHVQGMALLGDTLYVADTENHLLRKIDLKKQAVTTIAGTGKQARGGWPAMDDPKQTSPATAPDRWVGPPQTTALNSPWALWVHGDDLFIAMAGPHQIWKMPLDEREIGPYAGNGRENITDGPLLPPMPYQAGFSSFAQPSGLAGDDQWLYVADCEGSAIRAVPFDSTQEVRTLIGVPGTLFDFGDVDGPAETARLQHALGVVFYRDKLYVTDTYNNKVKVIDPQQPASQTLAGTGEPGLDDEPARFDEPAGITAAAGKLYVADTNNHRIRVIDLDADNRVSTLEIESLAPPDPPQKKIETADRFVDAVQVDVPPQQVGAVDNKVTMRVSLALPVGWKINPDAPQRYLVELSGPAGPVDAMAVGTLVSVDPPAATFEVPLKLKKRQGSVTVKVWLNYYYCQDEDLGLCKIGRVAWTVPLEITADGEKEQVKLSFEVP